MAPTLLVTKSSPPSGGGLRKDGPEKCLVYLGRDTRTSTQSRIHLVLEGSLRGYAAEISSVGGSAGAPLLCRILSAWQSGPLWTAITTPKATLASVPDKAFLLV